MSDGSATVSTDTQSFQGVAQTTPLEPALGDTDVTRPVPTVPLQNTPTPPVARRLTTATVLTVLGVLVPFAIMTWMAAVSAPTFDGGMNLQVARNLANGTGYARDYGGLHFYPPEVQTSGVYIYLAALLIKIFGAHTFVFQLPNLLFILMLLVTVSVGLRRWPVLRVIGPTVVLFAVPGLLENAMNGYGEYVVGALVLLGIVLLSTAVSSRRPVLMATIAFALLSVALTIKVVVVIAIPVLVVGLIGLAMVRRDVRGWKWVGALAALLVPLAVNEIYRLVSIGSISAYGAFWQNQLSEIGGQAGVSATGQAGTAVAEQGPGLLQTIADHLHLLSVGTAIPAEVLGLIVVLPFAALIALFVARRTSWRSWLARPGALLSIQLTAYSGGYLVWWLAITPTEKAWLRRIAIGLLALAFLYLALAGMVRDRMKDRAPVVSTRGRVVGRIGWGLAAAATFVVTLSSLATVRTQAVAALGSSDQREQQVLALAARAEQLAAGGNHLFGNGWWSAPVVSLYAKLPLRDLSKTAVCDPTADFASGKNYLIWDFYALNIASVAPQGRFYTFEQIPGSDTGYGGIWKIVLRPGVTCPLG